MYAGVETLLQHIALVHVGRMGESTRAQVGCVTGRVAGVGEAWDFNIPVVDGEEEGEGEGEGKVGVEELKG